MNRYATAFLVIALCSPPLLADARYVTASPSPNAVETVNWTAGVSYTYDGAGNVLQIGNDRFVYDQAGRLVQAEINGVNRTYEYDAFGNRKDCKHAPGTATESACQSGMSIDSSSNRVVGVSYDGAGNVETFSGHVYSYDAVNMPTRDDRGGGLAKEFIYTANDERIATYTVGSTWNWTIRDVSGKVLREFTSGGGSAGAGTGSWNWTRDNVFRDGLLLATRQVVSGAPVTYHYHLDHVGTPRRVTDQDDRTVGLHDYYAFGSEVSGGMKEPAATSLQYTGHERDKWDGMEDSDTLDYMHARYYSPSMGRFLSVDPVISKQAMRSPQLWNRYSYVGNNPVRFVDPDGRLLQLSGCVKDQSSDGCKGQMNLYLSTFGKQSGEAAKYLSVGKNGIVSFNGISGSAFGAKFGQMGRATNYLVSNRAATFSLVTGRSAQTAEGRGAFFDPKMMAGRAAGGGTIGVDPGAFPQAFFGVPDASATEALVHEIGHAVGSLIPGYASGVDAMAAASGLMRMGSGGRMEAYATAFENAWRRDTLGALNMRNGYFYPNDVRDIGSTPLFP